MKEVIKKTIAVLGLAAMLFASPGFVNACDPIDVYANCTATAYQNYKNGDYSAELYIAFIDDYCREAGDSCY